MEMTVVLVVVFHHVIVAYWVWKSGLNRSFWKNNEPPVVIPVMQVVYVGPGPD